MLRGCFRQHFESLTGSNVKAYRLGGGNAVEEMEDLFPGATEIGKGKATRVEQHNGRALRRQLGSSLRVARCIEAVEIQSRLGRGRSV